MAYFAIMKIGFPLKIKKTELMEKCQLESRHISIGVDMCCRILLLASGFKVDEFKIGYEEVHFRSGICHLLDEILESNKEALTLKLNKGFSAFQRRMIYLRLLIIGTCMFSFFFLFYVFSYIFK